MSALLVIARRVEDAVEAYMSVKEHTDTEAWREGLSKEKVSAPLLLGATSIISIFIGKSHFCIQKG
jgi:hypothetical protein